MESAFGKKWENFYVIRNFVTVTSHKTIAKYEKKENNKKKRVTKDGD